MNIESNSKTILLADEDEDVGHLLSVFLRLHGFGVITVQNGVDAIVAVSNNEISAIVTEWTLPVVDGYRLLNWLREEMGSAIPVIVLSAADNETVGKRIAGAGADAVLYKPASAFDILSELERALKQEAL